MKLFLLYVSLLIITYPALAQHDVFRQADSLKQMLYGTKPDTSRVMLMARISEAYRGAKEKHRGQEVLSKQADTAFSAAA